MQRNQELIKGLEFHVLDKYNEDLVGKIHELLASIFPSDEMDSIEDMQDELEGQKFSYRTMYMYATNSDGEVVAAVTGNIMELEETGEYCLAIGYEAVRKDLRFNGIGSELLKKYQEEVSRKVDGELKLIIVEAEANDKTNLDDKTHNSIGYWQKQEFYSATQINYQQPPMEFEEDGSGEAVAGLTLMIKPVGYVTRTDFIGALTIMMDSWYTPEGYDPEESDFNSKQAYDTACECVSSVIKKVTGSVPDILELEGLNRQKYTIE